jgi:hypothetical protein
MIVARRRVAVNDGTTRALLALVFQVRCRRFAAIHWHRGEGPLSTIAGFDLHVVDWAIL